MAFQPNDDAAWISLLRQQMDEMFNYMRETGSGRHAFSPPVDMYETADQLVIEVDLPGFAEKDFTVRVLGPTLCVEGIKRQDKNKAAMNYICLERHFGRFSRNLEIPNTFDPGTLRTTFTRGTLTITIAKR